jgi:hypothetical protein
MSGAHERAIDLLVTTCSSVRRLVAAMISTTGERIDRNRLTKASKERRKDKARQSGASLQLAIVRPWTTARILVGASSPPFIPLVEQRSRYRW